MNEPLDFSITAIENLKIAEAYFKEMGCSSFHMSREYPERYEEFLRLSIPADTKRVWRIEVVDELSHRLSDTATERDSLWSLHSSMDKLVQELATVKFLQQIFDLTESILPRLPNESKLLVAETIIG